jgi:hypothetical protein
MSVLPIPYKTEGKKLELLPVLPAGPGIKHGWNDSHLGEKHGQ